jgi:hypothetical protein
LTRADGRGDLDGSGALAVAGALVDLERDVARRRGPGAVGVDADADDERSAGDEQRDDGEDACDDVAPGMAVELAGDGLEPGGVVAGRPGGRWHGVLLEVDGPRRMPPGPDALAAVADVDEAGANGERREERRRWRPNRDGRRRP